MRDDLKGFLKYKEIEEEFLEYAKFVYNDLKSKKLD